MVLIGPESIVVKQQVVAVTSAEACGDNIVCGYEVRHPLDGNTYNYTIALPKDVNPASDAWRGLDGVFTELFPRREYMLVYRDAAKTALLEAVYKLVKAPPPDKAAAPEEPPAAAQ